MFFSRLRVFCALALALCAPAAALTPGEQAALGRVSADSLRGHVSFLASDLLQGRDTPSAGLDIAAEYIAAQFRRAGLEPAGDDGYFETAKFLNVKANPEGFELVFESGGERVAVPAEKVTLPAVLKAQQLSRAPLIKVAFGDDALAQWTPEQARGKVIVTALPDLSGLDREAQRKLYETTRAMRERYLGLDPALVITLTKRAPFRPQTRLIDPSDPQVSGPPNLQVNSPELEKLYEGLPPGAGQATLTYKQSAAVQDPVRLRNVAGILHGSDPALKDTYILVTAHYDHVGVRGSGEGDHIYNGANDDASGTASVLELAEALAGMKPRPKRSIVFMTYFGEEKGLLGSRYYGRHPLVPIAKTVADINLEQLGRTDDDDGPQVATATLTGFDYSDIPATFEKAGELTGVKVYGNGRNSDPFFARSDNQAMADVGIPAHTLLVAYEFPDYHRPGDEWEKLDYANMAKVDRMVAAGLMLIADNREPPRWNTANPKAARYVKAWKKLRASQ